MICFCYFYKKNVFFFLCVAHTDPLFCVKSWEECFWGEGGEGWLQVDIPMSTMWIHPVTRLENICQLNWKARQKAEFQFVT